MAFDYSTEWSKSEPQRVMDVIREVGVHRLANLDGCICSDFSIRNVEVEIRCGKSSAPRGIRVSSQWREYMSGAVELRVIADEVVRQLIKLYDGRGPLPVIIEEPS
jgi:hypothetical protein